MAQASDEVEQDLSHIHWSWPEAIAANPARSLATADLAMDYFAYSPFWDSKSNNNVLRTQRRVENPTYGHAEEKHELNAFNSGFEYIVAHSQPPDLFVIHRREVEPSGKRDRVSGAWFVLHDKVYQCPTLYDVVSTRLKNAAALVSKTLNTLSESRPPANPRATTVWRALPPSASSSSSAGSDSPASDPLTSGTGFPPVDSAEQDQEGGEDATVAKKEGAASASKRARGASTAASVPVQPDWHLFHALESTRASLPSLEEKAQADPVRSDPMVELRMIESGLAAQLSMPNPSITNGHQRNTSTGGAGSVRSVSFLGAPNAGPLLARGLSPMSMGSPARLGMSPGESLVGRGSVGQGAGASPMVWS